MTHCFSVFLSLDKNSIGEMKMNALESKFEKAWFSEWEEYAMMIDAKIEIKALGSDTSTKTYSEWSF